MIIYQLIIYDISSRNFQLIDCISESHREELVVHFRSIFGSSNIFYRFINFERS